MRAAVLGIVIAFISSILMENVLGSQESTTYAEEYELYQKAEVETDKAKQRVLLIQFVTTYKESALDLNISYLYGLSYAQIRKQRQWEQLASVAENFLRHRPNDSASIRAATEAYQHLGNSHKLIEFGSKLYNDSPSSDIAYLITRAYQSLNDDINFRKWGQRIIQHDPNNLEVLVELSNSYWGASDFTNSELYAKQALQVTEIAKKPDAQSIREWNAQLDRVRGFCYRAIAETAYTGKNTNKARDNFETSLRYDDHNDFTYYRLGLIYWGTRRTDEAVISLAKAVALNGANVMKAQYELDRLYISLHGNTKGLRTIIHQARTELNPR